MKPKKTSVFRKAFVERRSRNFFVENDWGGTYRFSIQPIAMTMRRIQFAWA